jgi:heme A synthase
MVSSGLKDKDLNKKVDKTPRVSPYRLTFHAGNAYLLYGVCLWQSMNLLRRPQEAVTTMKSLGPLKSMRLRLFGLAALVLPLVLTTGFLTAGTSAGIACNTFPKVGEHWFISRKHFMPDIPIWKNFVENKLVC